MNERLVLLVGAECVLMIGLGLGRADEALPFFFVVLESFTTILESFTMLFDFFCLFVQILLIFWMVF